jgi:DNA polymerase-1
MIKAKTRFKEKGLKAAMLLSVHDEIVFEVPPAELEILISLVKETMEGIWTLKVPLKVNVKSGKSWGEMQ